MCRDPALIFEEQSSSPGTHVLIVGIGCYDHLSGGSGEIFNDQLGQLLSPPASAKALADWFLGASDTSDLEPYDNPAKPLASVAMVVSTDQPFTYSRPGHSDVTAPAGSGEDVENAVQAWAKRARSHPENLSVLYFCGHGLEASLTPMLLARDFGGDPDKHENGVIEINSIMSAMLLMGPRHQVFFMDCCRVSDPTLLDQTSRGRRPITARPGGGPADVEQSTLQAVESGAMAHGRPDEPSVFAQSLLIALSSAANVNEAGEWWVGTLAMQRQMGKRNAGVQRGEVFGVDVDLGKLSGEPKIPVRVNCAPAESIHESRLSCTMLDGAHCCSHDSSVSRLTADHWETFLHPPGPYRFEASAVVDGAFDPVMEKRHIYSPIAFVTLKIIADATP